MRRSLGFFLVVLLTVGAGVGLTKAPDALAHVEAFRVTDITLDGARYLTYDEAVRTVAVPAGASVWDDLAPLTDRLRHHPLVLDGRVRRRLPGTLVLVVREREPVALVPTPTLTPVDPEGRLLPIDPTLHRLDLPLLQPYRDGSGGEVRLTPAQLRNLAGEVKRVGELDPNLLASVSDAAVDSWGDIILRLGEPRIALRYRAPLTPKRLREGLLVLADALERSPERRPAAVDLRFADQVVVRFAPTGNR